MRFRHIFKNNSSAPCRVQQTGRALQYTVVEVSSIKESQFLYYFPSGIPTVVNCLNIVSSPECQLPIPHFSSMAYEGYGSTSFGVIVLFLLV